MKAYKINYLNREGNISSITVTDKSVADYLYNILDMNTRGSIILAYNEEWFSTFESYMRNTHLKTLRQMNSVYY